MMARTDKKGQVGTGTVTTVVVGFIALIIIVFMSFVVIQALTTSNVIPTGTVFANSTTLVTANYTSGVNTLFSNTGTVFAVAVIALILGVLAIVFVLLRRGGFGGGAQTL